ncbi:MAG TPA: enoyl-CoA hydratase-related protein [Gammaproteobacteria bacterium]|nr:enoyl-CoA hydratase-related protein [Gammaproteobacteria bacterium]
MAQQTILLTKPHDNICLVTLNRPEKRNAIDGALISEWMRVLHDLQNDVSIRVILLNGNGEHFCAGADMTWMQKMAKCSSAENKKDALQLAQLLKMIYTFPKPVIGLVHGAVMGGGLGVTACCDVVIAAENASFCFSEVKLGLAPSVISPYVVPLIGEKSARYYFLTGEKFDVNTAIQLNLVHQTVVLEKLFDSGLSLAKTFLSHSQNALMEIKKLLLRVAGNNVSEEMMNMTAEHLSLMRATDDAKEGLNAFLEKRLPKWK